MIGILAGIKGTLMATGVAFAVGLGTGVKVTADHYKAEQVDLVREHAEQVTKIAEQHRRTANALRVATARIQEQTKKLNAKIDIVGPRQAEVCLDAEAVGIVNEALKSPAGR